MQGILGTSLNRPLFQVVSNDDNSSLSIYYGFNHLASIPNDKRSYLFKSMVAMLLRVGVCVRHIQQNFNISFQTAKNYLQAFEDAEKSDQPIYTTLKNPGRICYKVTKKMADFIYERALHYEEQGRTYYYRFIVADILKHFNIDLGKETIRLILKKYRTTNHSISKTPTIAENLSLSKASQLEKVSAPLLTEPLLANNIFRNQYCELLLASSYAHLVFDGFDDHQIKVHDRIYSLRAIIVWWILAILAGALNLEQQRYFAINDFEFISGFENLPSVETMRRILHDMSISQELKVSTIILQKNIDYFIEDSSDFYIDPHIEGYTGKKNILSAWSTLKNRVCKSSIDNFVHDSAGNPIFSLLKDNFNDLREVIITVMKKLETLFNKKPITLIYDRGGFSAELMEEIDLHENFFITWQKGFQQKDAKGLSFENKIGIEYPYNDLGKFEIREFKYAENTWEFEDLKFRRIIFEKETDKPDKFFYQSILSNDLKTDAGMLLKKMLKRTLQENDFKKEKNHFGIDEITSYRSLPYNALHDKDPEKKSKNKEYVKLLSQLKELRDKKKKLLAKLGIKALKKSHLNSKFYERNKKIINEVLSLDQTMKKIKSQKEDIDKEIPKLGQVINEGKVELDLRMKRLLNLIKITTRNIAEKGAQEFLDSYENLRDYQKVFRKLIRTPGEIRIQDGTLFIKLDRFGRKSFQKKIDKYIEKINQKELKSFDGKYVLHFETFS